MKILKIVNSEDSGGIFTCEQQFIRELKRRGVIVDIVIVGNGDKVSRYEEVSRKTFKLPDLEAGYSGSSFDIINGIWKTYRFGKANASSLVKEVDCDYDAIIYRRPIYIFLAGILSQLLKINAFWHMPGTVNSNMSRIFYTFFCKRYRVQPIGNSNYTKNTLGDVCKYVIYPGYDESRVVKTNPYFRNTLGISPDAPVYGMVARVCYDKAQDLLVQAFKESKIASSGGHLLIAGGVKDPKFLTQLKSYAGALLDKQIHFLGEINNLSEFYSSIDVAINSRRNEEAFGISVAEALGAEKPIIAYKLGGPSEMIIHDVNGWLVDVPTKDNYFQILEQSFKRRTEWPEIGRTGKEGATKFQAVRNVQNLIQIIEENNNVRR